MGILFLIYTHFFRNATWVEGKGFVYTIKFLVYLWRLAYHQTRDTTANTDLFDIEINSILLAYCLQPVQEDEWQVQKKFTSSKN
jgi:hypothetical protein